MSRKAIVLCLAILLTTSAGAAVAAWAKSGPDQAYIFSAPPRYTVHEAPGNYGGLLLIDQQTGEVYQRVIINGTQGVEIKWLKLPKVDHLDPNTSIQWTN